MKKDNRGLSLVELLMVIAIIGVVMGVGIWSINAMTGRPAQQCAQKIIYSLERHRVTAMGKVDANYTIRVGADHRIYCDEAISNNGTYSTSTSTIGNNHVTISYLKSDGNTVDMGTGDSVTLGFDRSSGSFKALSDGTYCTGIIAKSGGREVKVTLVRLTGKVYLD